jgi:hypothetical protein
MSWETTLVELEVIVVLAGVYELDELKEPLPSLPQVDRNVIGDTKVISLLILSFKKVCCVEVTCR